jgi:hypothetical protein
MILETAYSINNVPIRLTDERWDKIVDSHPYMSSYYERMLDAVEQPQYILRGQSGTLVAVVSLASRTLLHVMYREVNQKDGFIITAFIQTSFDRNKIIWREED